MPMCTVIVLSDNDGPVNRTGLRLNVSPDSKSKKTKISTVVDSPINPNTPMEPGIKNPLSLNIGWSITRCVSGSPGVEMIAETWLGGLSILRSAAGNFCVVVGCPPLLGSATDNRRYGSLIEDGLY